MPYTYTGTPRGNIEAAKARISSDGAVAETALSSYLKSANFAQQAVQTPTVEEPKEKVSFIRRLGETIGDYYKNILVGAQKAIEGIVDFGASTVGVIAGWAGNESLKNSASNFAARDLTTEWYDHLKNDYGIDTSFNHSFINDMSEIGQRISRGVLQGVGQMLPAVLTAGVGSAVTGSLQAVGKITAATANIVGKGIKAANLIGLGISAAGTSTEEALNTEIIDEDGNVKRPTLDRAYLYGLASGAVEIGTEVLVGGGYEKMFGGGVADKLISKLAKSARFEKAARFALNALGEGIEEVASEAVSNTLKTIYNSKDGKVHWESPDIMSMFESGVIGTLTAAAMGGGQAAVRKASNVMTVQDTMVEVENAQRQADALAAEGKYNGDTATKIENQLNANIETLSRRFQKASPKAQEKIIKNNPTVLDYLNRDGTIKKTSLNEGVAEISQEGARTAMSPSLMNRRNEVANTLAEHNTHIAESLDETQADNFRKVQTILKNSGIKTGSALKIVVAEEMSNANAFIKDDYFVISKERLNSTKTIAQDLAHESTHFAEGTKEYTQYVDFLLDNLSNREGTVKLSVDGVDESTLNLYQQSIYDVYKNSTAAGRTDGYNITQEVFDALSDGKLQEKVKNGEALSQEERLLLSEVIAKGSEYLLGNETVINDLANNNRSLAKKVLANIKRTIKMIETAFKGDKEALAELSLYRKAEKLYEKALASSGEEYMTKKAIKRAIVGDTQYSLKETQKTALAKRGITDDRLLDVIDLADQIQSVNGEITNDAKAVLYHATTSENAKKIIETGKMYGKEDNLFFSTKADGQILGYGDSIVEAQIPLELLKLNDIFDNEAHLTMAVTPYKMTDIRFSLKESNGNILSEGQEKYFADSKVRDNDGNLLVVYHGSPNQFFTFDRNRVGKGTDQFGAGFYFVSDESTSRHYGDNVYETYLNIKNPIVINRTKNGGDLFGVDITVKQAYEILKKHPLIYDSENSPLGDMFEEYWEVGAKDYMIREVAKNYTNIGLLDSDYLAFREYPNELHEAIRDVLGFDGIEVRFENTNAKFYIAWFENQIKLTSNLNPTQNEDISFSLKNTEGESITDKAKRVISQAVSMSWEGKNPNDTAIISETHIRQYAKSLVEEVMIVDPQYYDYVADQIAGELLTNALVDESVENISEIKRDYNVLRSYLHKINLNGLRSEIKSAYDNLSNSIFLQWHSESGLSFDQIVSDINQDLKEFSIDESIAPADQFFQFLDCVERCRETINHTANESLVDRISKENGIDSVSVEEALGEVQDSIRDYIRTEFLDKINLSKEERLANEQQIAVDKKTVKIKKEQQTIFEKKKAEIMADAERAIKSAWEQTIRYREEITQLESMLGEALLGGIDTFPGFKGKINTENAVDSIYRLLKNTSDAATRQKYIDHVADYIIEKSYLSPLYLSPSVQSSQNIVTSLKKFLRNTDMLSAKYLGAENYKLLSGRWGAKKSTFSIAQMIDAARNAGIEIAELPSFSSDPAAYFDAQVNAVLKINTEYEKAKDVVMKARRKAKSSLNKIFTSSELANLKKDITNSIESALQKDKKEVIVSLIKNYENISKNQQTTLAEGIEYNNVVNSVLDTAEFLKPNSKKHYENSSALNDKNFTKVIGNLGKLKYRSDIRKASARKVIAEFGKWYNANNKLLNGDLDLSDAESQLASLGHCGYLYADVIEAIRGFEERLGSKAPLSLDELKDADIILKAAKHILQNYDRETVNGKQIILSESSRNANNTAAKFVNMHKKGMWIKEAIRAYGYNIIDPKTVIAEMFGYEDNVLSQAFNDIQNGETNGMVARLEMLTLVDDFYKEHRGYKKRLSKTKITVGGHEISLSYALSLYMLSQQQASIDGLQQGGWGYYDKQGYWQDCGTLADSDIQALADSFSQADRDFLKVARAFFDKSGKYMYDTDLELKGYSTIELKNSDYFPISRYAGDFARSVDQSYMQAVMNASVANLGVTKQRVKNARRINVSSIIDIMEAHAHDIGMYAGLAVPVKAFQRIYNCNVSENGGVESIRNTLNEKVWSKFNTYVTNLLADIQGITGKRGLGDKIIDTVRSAYAKYQLGANVKVILSQMASFPTAFSYLSMSSMIKGIGHSFNARGVDRHSFTNMDKYCPWARVRNANSGIVLAESVTDKIGTVGDALTKPIQWTDRLTIGVMFNSCMAEVERIHRGDASYKYGTVDNMTEAGKMLEQIGRDTQPNYTQSERSALQRSSSSLVRTFTMFSSVPTKQISRLIEAFGRERALRYKQRTLHETVSAEERKATHAFTCKTITAVTVANVVYVLMGELVKFILNKDREDEDGNPIPLWQDMLTDLMSTTAGMFPFIKDAYNVIVQGYDNENFMSSAINELITSIKDLYESAAQLASGEPHKSSDILRPMRDFCYAIGQLTGIPMRNIYNLVYGLIKRFDPSTAYEMNSLFYGTSSFSADLKKATQNGDTELQTTIIGLMLKDDGMTSTSKTVNEKIRSLYSNGYTVLPKSVRDSISYNGETYEMSARQQDAFKKVYAQANTDVETLLKSNNFNALSEEVQAKSIKWIYDYYYENAVYSTLGIVADSKRLLFGEVMNTSKFAMTIAACSFVEGKQDRAGNTIAGSKKVAIIKLLNRLSLTKGEKAMILAYLGYDVSEFASIIKNYISRLRLSKVQQKVFLSYISL